MGPSAIHSVGLSITTEQLLLASSPPADSFTTHLHNEESAAARNAELDREADLERDQLDDESATTTVPVVNANYQKSAESEEPHDESSDENAGRAGDREAVEQKPTETSAEGKQEDALQHQPPAGEAQVAASDILPLPSAIDQAIVAIADGEQTAETDAADKEGLPLESPDSAQLKTSLRLQADVTADSESVEEILPEKDAAQEKVVIEKLPTAAPVATVTSEAVVQPVVDTDESANEDVVAGTREAKKGRNKSGAISSDEETATATLKESGVSDASHAPTDHAITEHPETDRRTGPHERITIINHTTAAGGESETNALPPHLRIAQHLLAKDGERPGRGMQLSNSDQVRLVERVARAFRAAEARNGVVKLRLHPPELGSVRLELRMQNGALTARLEAESTATQAVLLENFQALRDRLNEQGVRVERFDVDVQDRSSQGQHEASDRQPSRDESAAQRQAAFQARGDASDQEPRRDKPLAHPGQLNVMV